MTIIIIPTIILVRIYYPKMAISSSRSRNTLKRFRGSQETTKTTITDKYYHDDDDDDDDDCDDENLDPKRAGRRFSTLVCSLLLLLSFGCCVDARREVFAVS